MSRPNVGDDSRERGEERERVPTPAPDSAEIDKAAFLQRLRQSGQSPQMADYAATVEHFSWDGIRSELGLGPSLAAVETNLGFQAVDRWVRLGAGERVALRFVRRDRKLEDLTYRELAARSGQFANLLRQLGVEPGERVFSLLGRCPDLYVAAVGAIKFRAVFCPLFSQFGPEPVRQRLDRGDAAVLVTSTELYEKKIVPQLERLPGLRRILLIDSQEDQSERVLSLSKWMQQAEAAYEIPVTAPDDFALLHFTSGTTGAPKGALHVHEAGLVHYATGKLVLDLRPEDVFWCTADPGWVTGTSYGIFAPLLVGATNLVDEAEFDARRWYELLAEQRVNVWYTAPTAIRRLMRIPGRPAEEFDLSPLRLITSVGEPLNPEAVWWGQEALGLPIHDNWWQTETGGIMIANYLSMPVRPGSMGRPLPGVEAALVQRTGEGLKVIDEAGVEGELALRPGWPSMFRGYLHDDERYQRCFRDGWYLSGDLARSDADGYFWFVGRADDIIKTSGHMVGPFEVESALMEHPAIAEAGVIGKPDSLIGQLVKAFVVLKPGKEPSEALRRELIGFGRTRLGAAVAPKEIDFLKALPKTRSGKVLRRLLQARELGLPEGDLSTLEEGA